MQRAAIPRADPLEATASFVTVVTPAPQGVDLRERVVAWKPVPANALS